MPRTITNLSSEPTLSESVVNELQGLAKPLRSRDDLSPIVQQCSLARVAMLGESSHGTSEFYQLRAALSQQLIEEADFRFIAVEGDWPDCYAINRYVKGLPDCGDSALEVLDSFSRWPTWMWGNAEVATFVEWLRNINDAKMLQDRLGFYGLDVYSLWQSLAELQRLLSREDDLRSAQLLHNIFRCFEPYGTNAQAYSRGTLLFDRTCTSEIHRLIEALNRRTETWRDDEGLQVLQNAEILRNAEHYYRTMVRSNVQSWNIRDRHMNETLSRLLQQHGGKSKGIVWAHNTHIGDARFTDMQSAGMVNLGQLARESYGREAVCLVGFSTYEGSVIAAEVWGNYLQVMSVPEARTGSWDHALHLATGGCDGILVFPEGQDYPALLEPRGQRAIGVVYDPDYDSLSNYASTVLPHRFDALIHIERSHALHPLIKSGQVVGEPSETFPSAV